MVNGSQIRILNVDDHRLYREGMAAVISDQADMLLVAEAANGPEALQQFRQHKPDITLMDSRLKHVSGVEVMGSIQKEFPDARMIMVSTFEGELETRAALQAGAWAHILKTMHPREIASIIRRVHNAEKCAPLPPSPPVEGPSSKKGLTASEVEILAQAAGGKRVGDIGRRLLIPENMVRSHLEKIMKKMDARDYSNAIAIAAQRGFIRL